MPEGVEILLSAELIRPLVKNQIPIFIDVGDKSRYRNSKLEGLEEFKRSLMPFEDGTYPSAEDITAAAIRIVDVKTKGKFMYWIFSNGWYLLNTFGMSGQWSPIAGKHPCLTITYHAEVWTSSSQRITFNDPRHFGTIKFTNNKQELLDKLNELGWDPLQDSYSSYQEWLKSTITSSKKPIGQLLMDQSLFAGVGNYIRAEALYLSRLSPWRTGESLSKQNIDFLCKSIVMVMEESYKYQGATIQTYKTAYGEEGKYSSCFKVYGQKTDPLGNPVVKEDTPEGRTIHWCPTLQG